MGQAITLTVTAKGQKEFDKVLTDYMKWNGRQPKEIVAAKAYFIGLNALSTTKTADKTQVAANLAQDSKEYSGVPLAAILVNMKLKANGKKGLNGKAMAKAVDKYIVKAMNHVQFLRSGWLPAIKKLNFWKSQGDVQFSNRFAPKKPQGVKQYGKDKGNAILRETKGKASITIQNFVGQGKQDSKTVRPILQQGLDKAVAMELASMKDYITKKYQEQFKKMERQKTF